jgi:hypothetical protein
MDSQQWSAVVTCGRDCSPHTVVFQCASMNAAALRGHIVLSVSTPDPNAMFIYRLRVTDTSILFTRNFGVLQSSVESSDNGEGGLLLRRSTSSESPATPAMPPALNNKGTQASGAPQRGDLRSEIIFATARRDAAPRLEFGKIRVQVMPLRSAEDRSEALRCLQSKDWQALNRVFSAAEAAGTWVQTFNLSCEVDPVVGRSMMKPLPMSDMPMGLGRSSHESGPDSSLNTPRSATSSAGGPLMPPGIAAIMFGAGALIGATAAVVIGRIAKNSGK